MRLTPRCQFHKYFTLVKNKLVHLENTACNATCMEYVKWADSITYFVGAVSYVCKIYEIYHRCLYHKTILCLNLLTFCKLDRFINVKNLSQC